MVLKSYFLTIIYWIFCQFNVYSLLILSCYINNVHFPEVIWVKLVLRKHKTNVFSFLFVRIVQLIDYDGNIQCINLFRTGFVVQVRSSIDDEKTHCNDFLERRCRGCRPIMRKIARTGFINTLLRISRMP